MTAALTPELALALLRELSTDVRGAAIRGPGGRLLAGEQSLEGSVIRARSGDLEVAVGLGPLALPGLAAHDVAFVVQSLAVPAGSG